MKAKDVREVAHWARRMIFNPPIVWNNEDGTFSHTENVKRFAGDFTRWDMRPMIFHTAFTKHLECGCRKRFGIKHTIWCSSCAGIELGEDES